MNVRIRLSYSAIKIPRCVATLMARLCLALVPDARQHGQRWVLPEARIGLGAATQVEDASLRRLHYLHVLARRAQPGAGAISGGIAAIGHGRNGWRQPERRSWI